MASTYELVKTVTARLYDRSLRGNPLTNERGYKGKGMPILTFDLVAEESRAARERLPESLRELDAARPI